MKIKFGDKNYHKERNKSLKSHKKDLIITDKSLSREKLFVAGHTNGFSEGFKLGEKSKHYCKNCGIYLTGGVLFYCDKCENKLMKEIDKEFGGKKC